MSEQPLPDDLRALLAAERERPDLDADRVASLFDRMSATLALPDAPAAPDAPAPPEAPAPADPPVAAPDPGVAARLLQKYPFGSLLAALAIGASGGAAVTHAVESSSPPPATMASAVASTVSPPVSAPENPPPSLSSVPMRPAPSTVMSAPPIVVPSARPDATGTRDADLAVERTLIERARSAMVRGNPQDALAATREHAQRFPSGRFAEERDFITIRALAASGDKTRARAAADAFRSHHPQSLLLPAVDEVAP